MKIIIIGSGIAGISCAEELTKLSAEHKITVLTKETDGYYSRPQLSMGFSQPNIKQSIIIETFEQLLNNHICIIPGVEVSAIERSKQQVFIKGVEEIETLDYDKLILALGSSAFIPPPLLAFRDCFYTLNSLQDLKKLLHCRSAINQHTVRPHWAIIGGGLIGCEVASDLAHAQDKVTIFHAMDRLMERQLLKQDSDILAQVLEKSDVEIRFKQSINILKRVSNKIQVITYTECSEFDSVILACGFKPRTELANQAKLSCSRGILCNQFLQTDDPNIYALGDVAELPNAKLYAYIKPIHHQAIWLARYLSGLEDQSWTPPPFSPSAKVNNFQANQPYQF